ncbi:MAG: insulinase family protein [Abditibacteriota bacterium]|nr:insulinase family protein [Abditibacteriota bacterium]
MVKTHLPGGLTVVSEHLSHAESVSLGVWVRAGSRDESPRLSGISHFTEHMVFKGTHRRTAEEISAEAEGLGCDLNAFTDKEYTCYHTRALPEYTAGVLDIIADMLTDPLLSERDAANEKGVVIDEIRGVADVPEDLIIDETASLFFGSNRLGQSVAGSEKTVSAFTPEDVRGCMAARYRTENIVVAAAGKVDHDNLVALAEKLFAPAEGESGKRTFDEFKPVLDEKIIRKDVERAQFTLTVPAYPVGNERRYALAILDTVLGGSSSSRLFTEVREKRGLAYSVGSYGTAFADCGTFTIYGGTAKDKVEEAVSLCKDCAREIRGGVTEKEADRAKNLLRAGILMSGENSEARMNRIGRSEIYGLRHVPQEESIERLMAVTTDDVRAAAEDLLGDDRYAKVVITGK